MKNKLRSRRSILRVMTILLIGLVGCCATPPLLEALFAPLGVPIGSLCDSPKPDPAPTTPIVIEPPASQPATLPAATVVFSNLSFVSPGCDNNILDLYVPADGVGASATLLFIHGGGWFTGDKGDSAALCGLIAERGIPVVCCNYTLSTIENPGFPQAVYDVKAVVRWIRTEGVATYRLSPQIVVVGESAGGHLALMLGTTAGVARFEPLSAPPGGYRVDAVVGYFAPGDLLYHAEHGSDLLSTAWFLGALLTDETRPLYEEASPITYITADDPPIALFHGTTDAIVPIETAYRIQRDFANACQYCRLSVVPDVGHGFDGFGGDAGVALAVANLIPSLMAAPIEPDLNGDGVLDFLDIESFVALLVDPDAYFAAHAGCGRLMGDLNGDGLVDGRDIAFMVQRLSPG